MNDQELILKVIKDVWQVDANDCEQLSNGFHWWPGTHRVTVRCEEGAAEDLEGVWRVWVETDVARGVDVRNPLVRTLLSGAAMTSPTYACVVTPSEVVEKYALPDDGNLKFHSSVYVSPETKEWLPRFFAQLAILQPIDAERLGSPELTGMLEAKPNLSGPRFECGDHTFDDILNVGEHVLRPMGQGPSRWLGQAEFGDIASRFGQGDLCFGNGDETGLTLETPFGSDSALVRLIAEGNHPMLGSGLLATIELPIFDTFDEILDICTWLNFFAATSWTAAPALSSWHPKERAENRFYPGYGAFIPNALYAPGIATNMALWNLALARWAKRSLWPDMVNKSLTEILSTRFDALNGKNSSVTKLD